MMRFAVVDVETTGGKPDYSDMTEIAIAVVENQKITHRFSTLLKPRYRIPFNITQLTGIHDGMVETAPTFQQVADEVFELLKDCIFVAHRVEFDLAFVKRGFQQCGIAFSPSKKICTVRYARKVIPNKKSYSLASLCSHYSIRNKEAHRAWSDTEATAELLIALLKEDHDNALEKLLKVGNPTMRLPDAIPAEVIKALPQSPGIYRFYNKQGKLIYIGKAKNIYKRVMSHFTGEGTSLSMKLREHAVQLEYSLFGSELLAALSEDHEIRHHWPLFNKAQKEQNKIYNIVHYQDLLGNHRLAVQIGKKMAQALRYFFSMSAARSWLIKQVEDYGLHPGYCQCEGFVEHTTASDEVHNTRFETFLSLVKRKNESYIIQEQGRSEQEKAFVWVEKGNYRGIGFIPNDAEGNIAELLEMHLIPMKESAMVWSLVLKHLEKSPKSKKLLD